jgi:hypothetical protein
MQNLKAPHVLKRGTTRLQPCPLWRDFFPQVFQGGARFDLLRGQISELEA